MRFFSNGLAALLAASVIFMLSGYYALRRFNPTLTLAVFCYSFLCRPACVWIGDYPIVGIELWQSSIVSLTTSEESFVRNQESVEIWQVIPLVLAAALLTIGLAMFLSGTEDFSDVVRPVIVVFGGTLAALLITFSTAQISQALQIALIRGVRGGAIPLQMVRAMLKVCEVSRREGLLGVADVRSDSTQVEEVCSLIGDASEDVAIRSALERRLANERIYHQMTSDVFLFTAIYAGLMGVLGTLLLYVSHASGESIGPVFLPFVCGVSLAIMMSILIGRLRSAHMREMIIAEIAYQAATIILDDNNVQRLYARLIPLVPLGLRR